MSFIGWLVALVVVGSLLAVCLWILYYHYRNRRLGLTNQPFLPPFPAFIKKKKKNPAAGGSGRGVDLESGGRPYEGLGGDDAWDAREEYEGARLAGSSARGFDGQDERRYDDDDLDNPFGDTVAATGKIGGGGGKSENPFGSGARRVEDDDAGAGDLAGKTATTATGPQGSRRSLFNEDI
jgi:hypothetical protein